TSGFWAIVDQGAYAGTNFIVNIALARWLPPDAYGAFAVAYAAFVFFVVVHTALVLEPLLVYQPGRYRDRATEYLAVTFGGQTLVGIGCALALAAAAGILSVAAAPKPVPALLGAAVATPFVLTLWYFRRVCYVRLTPRHAAAASVCYLILSCGALAALQASESLDEFGAFCALGVAALPIAGWFALRLGAPSVALMSGPFAREVAAEHLRYGRWSFGNNTIVWLRDNLLYFVLPLTHGFDAAGALRALMNLVLPFLQVATSLTTILIPALVRARGTPEFVRLLRTFAAGLAAFGGVTWMALGLAAGVLTGILYAGKYSDEAGLMWLLGAIPLAHFLILAAWCAYLAEERPDAVFAALARTTVPALAAGLVLATVMGVAGAVIALTGSYLILMAALLWRLGQRKVPA
ncbi:MAG: lipopolysaccharide biosynthesis protein, partial [Reyranellaceae bacterium]